MEIILDDSSEVTFPGNNVSGVLCVREYTNSNQKPVIMVIGFTSILFHPDTKKPVNKCSNFFIDKAKLSPEKVDESDVLLRQAYGEYSKIFTFYLTLPNNLPPSHEVPFGHTRYKLEACFNDQKASTFFSVNNWVHLKQNKNTAVNRSYFRPKGIFGLGCNAELCLAQLNYFPGENVNVRAEIKNDSPTDVLSSQISIQQITKYWIDGKRKPFQYIRDIAESPNGSYLYSKEHVEYNYSLNIPAVIPSTSCSTFTSKSSFINYEVKYNIKMLIEMSNSKIYELNQELFIGNLDTTNNSSYEVTHREAEELEDINDIEFTPNYLVYVKPR